MADSLRAIALAALLSTGSAFGQGAHYSPRGYGSAAGNITLSSPLTAATDLTWQQLHDGVPAMAVRRLNFRRSILNPDAGLSASLTVEIQLRISTAPHAAANASTVFASNHGRDVTTVIGRRQFRFFPTPWIRGVRVQPDTFYQLPFDRAFPFAGGTICWQTDSKNLTPPGPPPWLDAASATMTSAGIGLAGAARRFGTNCTATGLRSLQFGMTAHSHTLSFNARAVLTGTPVPTAAIARIGRSELRTRTGLPLPFDLGPLGAPGCKLYTSAEVEVPMSRSSILWTIGNGLFQFPYAAFRSQAGLPLYAQLILLTPTNNPLGIDTTEARRFDVPVLPLGDLGVRSIIATLGAPNGGVSGNTARGLIVGFSPR